MTAPLRRGGSGTDATGARVTWSVAEGRRGRRWREVRVAPDGGILTSMLLETDPDGRFSHLELSTPAGLVTLHPEGDGTLHGNTIGAARIDHVRGLPWSPDAIVTVEGSVVALAAAARAIRAGAGQAVPAVEIGTDLALATTTLEVERVRGAVDDAGLPILDAAVSWPLEEA